MGTFYLEKETVVWFGLKFCKETSTDDWCFEVDFVQLDKIFPADPRKRTKKFDNEIQFSERDPFEIEFEFNRLDGVMTFRAKGEVLEVFMERRKNKKLQLILNAKFDNGLTIDCKMFPKRDSYNCNFEGRVDIPLAKYFVADQDCRAKVSVKMIDKDVFGFVQESSNGFGLLSFLEEKRFCDFTIIADNEASIQCHRMILAAKSPVLSRMLEMDCVETRQKRLKMNASEAAIKAFLKFIYYSDLEDTFESPLVAVELMELGHKYDVGMLEETMKKFILKKADEWLDIDAALKLFLYSVSWEGDEYELFGERLRVVKEERKLLKRSVLFQDLLKNEPDTITNFFIFILQP
ncbi:Ring canal kelch protein [Orchesella cincta]|uniref:Ring canal kelch protein n=1 Tax=Orchesella cincta TaxID=48709 RepID=A0A1D2MI14_ORCCI|nr:Ring canal kelch protein [Orchesella cincta]